MCPLFVASAEAVSTDNILPSGSKRAVRPPTRYRSSISATASAGKGKEQTYVPEAVLKKDEVGGVVVYEIKWQGLSESQNTWVPLGQFDQPSMSQYKHLISDFEEGSSPFKAASRTARKSVSKEDKGLWPPADEAAVCLSCFCIAAAYITCAARHAFLHVRSTG